MFRFVLFRGAMPLPTPRAPSFLSSPAKRPTGSWGSCGWWQGWWELCGRAGINSGPVPLLCQQGQSSGKQRSTLAPGGQLSGWKISRRWVSCLRLSTAALGRPPRCLTLHPVLEIHESRRADLRKHIYLLSVWPKGSHSAICISKESDLFLIILSGTQPSPNVIGSFASRLLVAIRTPTVDSLVP